MAVADPEGGGVLTGGAHPSKGARNICRIKRGLVTAKFSVLNNACFIHIECGRPLLGELAMHDSGLGV